MYKNIDFIYTRYITIYKTLWDTMYTLKFDKVILIFNVYVWNLRYKALIAFYYVNLINTIMMTI